VIERKVFVISLLTLEYKGAANTAEYIITPYIEVEENDLTN